jgi:hypothetical protein
MPICHSSCEFKRRSQTNCRYRPSMTAKSGHPLSDPGPQILGRIVADSPAPATQTRLLLPSELVFSGRSDTQAIVTASSL